MVTPVQTNGSETAARDALSVPGVRPTPRQAWETMLRFSGPTPAEQAAMRQTVDVLFQRGYELVVNTYEHLQRTPETAEVLGWQTGAESAHLAERRRFFTIWLARTISLDLGADFAQYLFRAGQIHGGHGPRHIETPAMWVTGSIGLVLGAFAGFIQSAHDDVRVVAPALSGWNKYLLAQLNQMHLGYATAADLDRGSHPIVIRAYAMVRHEWGQPGLTARFSPGDQVVDVLRKLLDYAPRLREIMFDVGWESEDSDRDLWLRVKPVYLLRPGWRVQLNGKNLTFHGGFRQPLREGDTLDLFSPGR
ncbi:MAG: hypothetical protein HZC41_20065 [Chloroflexi bacterium]|nr:hypothetical protein [Chloroflexota bacterium]